MTSRLNPQRLQGPLIDLRTGRGEKDFLDFLYRLWKRTGGTVSLVVTGITGGTGISVTGDPDGITVTVVPSQIDHDGLLNYAANRHVNHNTVVMNAGTGLSGGGAIDASRTFNVNMLGLQNLAAPAADRIYFYDFSETAAKFLEVADGLSITAAQLAVALQTDKGLEFAAGELGVKVEANKGLALTSAGLKIANYSQWDDWSTAPILMDSSLSAGESQTASTQNGRFKRLDDTVQFTVELTMTGLGTLTGGDQAVIGPLPVALAGVGHVAVQKASGLGLANAGEVVSAEVTADGIKLWLWDAVTGTTALSVTEFSASGSIVLSGWYPV